MRYGYRIASFGLVAVFIGFLIGQQPPAEADDPATQPSSVESQIKQIELDRDNKLRGVQQQLDDARAQLSVSQTSDLQTRIDSLAAEKMQIKQDAAMQIAAIQQVAGVAAKPQPSTPEPVAMPEPTTTQPTGSDNSYGEDLSEIKAMLKDENVSNRMRAIGMLAGARSSEATSLLVGMLGDFSHELDIDNYALSPSTEKYDTVCDAAIGVLGQRRDTAAVKSLIPLLRPRTVRVPERQITNTHDNMMGAPAQYKTVIASVYWDGSEGVAEALGEIGDRTAVDALIASFDSRHRDNAQPNQQLNISRNVSFYGIAKHATALSLIGDAKAAPHLASALRAAVPYTVYHPGQFDIHGRAALYSSHSTTDGGKTQQSLYEALERLKCPATTDAMVGILTTPLPDGLDAAPAGQVLARQKDIRAVQPLIDGLTKLSALNRISAVDPASAASSTGTPARRARKAPLARNAIETQIDAIANALAGITGKTDLNDDPGAWQEWLKSQAPTTQAAK